MKKCKGCGAILQSEDKQKIGYIPDLNQDYCKRCFRLSHYGDITNLNNKVINNKDILKIYDKYKKEVFVLIVDVFDALVMNEDSFFDLFDDKNFILIINKTDLLPKNISDKKVDDIFASVINKFAGRHHNLLSCILTHKKDSSFCDVFMDTIKMFSTKTYVFAGRANAGKSSLINKLLNDDVLTTSVYPGTTLSEIELMYKGYIFIDTPGYLDEENVSTYLQADIYKDIMIKETIKPQVFQLYENQTYFYEDILRIDLEPKKNASIIFYMNNDLNIHRTKTNNANRYLDNKKFKYSLNPKEMKEYEVQDKAAYYIKGLGYFKVSSECKMKLYIFAKIKVYLCEVLI